MTIQLDVPKKGHLRLHADCIPVRGATTSAIYDLSRHRMVLFPTAFFDAVCDLRQGVPFPIQDEDSPLRAAGGEKLLSYLMREELTAIVEDLSLFPLIDMAFDRASQVSNALIDVDKIWHDFLLIARSLDALGCEFVQVRIFSSDHSFDKIRDLVRAFANTSVRAIELLIHYEIQSDLEALKQFLVSNPTVTHLTVHSAPKNFTLDVDSARANEVGLGTGRWILFLSDVISSSSSCGKISIESINAPSVVVFSEALKFNGCLNGKISIDVDGSLKNCPSMKKVFGKVADISRVARDTHFQAAWHVVKDQISVCKDCQFRYSCTDCRAHVIDPSDPLSKPSRCGYDPYLDEWSAAPSDNQFTDRQVRMT